jgi:hypothetical protein
VGVQSLERDLVLRLVGTESEHDHCTPVLVRLLIDCPTGLHQTGDRYGLTTETLSALQHCLIGSSYFLPSNKPTSSNRTLKPLNKSAIRVL